jgi:hypothetical protein
VQGNYDEFRFFTGLRPSEQIALTVTDYDRKRGALSINKARVRGVDKDCTKPADKGYSSGCRPSISPGASHFFLERATR